MNLKHVHANFILQILMSNFKININYTMAALQKGVFPLLFLLFLNRQETKNLAWASQPTLIARELNLFLIFYLKTIYFTEKLFCLPEIFFVIRKSFQIILKKSFLVNEKDFR